MSTRNLTIQLDEELIREARVLAAEQGTSVSAMVAQDLRTKLAARARRTSAMQAAFESMDAAARSGRSVPGWTREEINDRW
jgi:plasmid stability protein